jgi:hypothetical protein
VVVRQGRGSSRRVWRPTCTRFFTMVNVTSLPASHSTCGGKQRGAGRQATAWMRSGGAGGGAQGGRAAARTPPTTPLRTMQS